MRLDAWLQELPSAVRTVWESADERRELLWDALTAAEAGDGEAATRHAAVLDHAAEVGLRALGFPLTQVRSISIRPTHTAPRVTPPGNLQLDPLILRRRLHTDGPDELWRMWVQETSHTRHLIPDDYLTEYYPFPGYEEGLSEGVALFAVRDVAAIQVRGNSFYGHFVRAYRQLAEALGVEAERLFQKLWDAPAGRVREKLPRAISILRGNTLTADRHHEIIETADRFFASKKPKRDQSDRELLDLWKKALT